MSGAPGPGSLVENERALQKLTDDYTDPNTNEGNLLTLITLKNILGTGGQNEEVLKRMAKEETRHLMLAMRILTEDGTGAGGAAPDPATAAAATKLQEKYGRDMRGALKLGNVLKQKADEKEVEQMLAPFVLGDLTTKGEERIKRAGFNLGSGKAGFGDVGYVAAPAYKGPQT